MAAIVKFKPGTYTATIKAENYPETQVNFTVKRGKHVDIDVVLKPTGVKGTATQNNQPKAGLHVRVVGTAFTTLTDANGHYSFIGLAAGTYTIEVANEGGDTATATVVVVNGVMEVVDLAI